MDEKQLGEMNNSLDLLAEEDCLEKNESLEVKKIVEYVVAGLVIGFIVTASGFYLWVKLHQGYESIEIYNESAQTLPPAI